MKRLDFLRTAILAAIATPVLLPEILKEQPIIINFEDAHRMQLAIMDANGQLVKDGVMYWKTPDLKEGIAFKVTIVEGQVLIESYPLS